ncbi:MAG: lysine--tRNA ligase [Spirochaetales bacterium]|nr:lysine--tRNA ligase [Spirochaetales bacterium]
MNNKPEHWADQIADKIIRAKGDKEPYVCASGITPSGTVHIGNFREIISVDLIVRALRHRGKKVRFIYSWDDYDVFRKIPANMPNKEMLENYLRKPIIETPDPYEKEASYAQRNEKEVEEVLPIVGIHPEYLYQADRYKKSAYVDGIKKALEKKTIIMDILNKYRTTPLTDSWWPISIFCGNCRKDTTEINLWDGNDKVSYNCSSCGHKEEVDLKTTHNVKLLWRIDWPMRWDYEKVDFEPAGKEHHSSGGSFDTAKHIASSVYGFDPPITFKYDFISIKGKGGKISSSLGNVISLKDTLEIYQPEIVRFLFVSTRPDTEFAISFDLDVIKIYEDYDKCERMYFGKETVSEKKKAKIMRNYELSQIREVPKEMPYQMPFRHLCNLLQIANGDISSVIDGLGMENDEDTGHIRQRAECAWNWIQKYAPESFRFTLRPGDAEPIPLSPDEKKYINEFKEILVKDFDTFSETTLAELFYSLAEQNSIDTKVLFQLIYRVLIGKEMGPRLANFILTIGKEKILKLLSLY